MSRFALTLSFGLAALVTSGSAVAQTYDCEIESPKALVRNGDNAQLNSIDFPGLGDGVSDFTLEIEAARRNEAAKATIDWPSDPFQLAGSFPALSTAAGSLVFSAYSGGPCMFTEQACMSLVHFVEQSDGTAKIVILPSALGSDEEADTREPFIAIIEGTCTRKRTR